MNRCAHQGPWGCRMLLGACRPGCGKFEPVRGDRTVVDTAEETLTERQSIRPEVRPFVSFESVCGGPAVVVGVKGEF